MIEGLLILRPTPVTDAILIASNIPEADAPVYNPATSYAVGDIVMLLSTHSVYENSLPANAGNSPELHPDKWTRIRATNRWRCFDGRNSSLTQQASSISYTFLPGESVPMVAALGLVDCSELRVRLIDPTYGTVYDHTATPSPSPVLPDWWEFYFGEWEGGASVVLMSDLPSFPNATLQIDLVGLATMAIGQLLFGQPRVWGIGIEYGARVGRQRYSRHEVNDFGDIDLVKRPSAKRASFELVITDAEVDPIQEYLDGIDADVCLFVGAERYECTVIAGVFESFEVLLANAKESTVQLDILGVT